jgi:biopolymer transport protein ExbB
MNTTAFGLMSAIPLLLFHAKLASTTGQIIDSLEMASIKALNTVCNFNRFEFETNPGLSDGDLSEGVDRQVPIRTSRAAAESPA